MRRMLLAVFLIVPWSVVVPVALRLATPTLNRGEEQRPTFIYECPCSPAMLNDWVCVYRGEFTGAVREVVQAPVRGWQ